MEANKFQKMRLLFVIIILTTFFFSGKARAQDKQNYMRIANITVDSSSLEKYKTALKEQMKDALKLEPGVLAYTAVYHKNNPTQITF